MTDKPLWRTAVEKADEVVEPQLIKVVEHGGFAIVTGVAYHLRHALGAEAERISGALLHSLNLPTRTDVTRVLQQVASLQRELRDLHDELETPGPRRESDDATSGP